MHHSFLAAFVVVFSTAGMLILPSQEIFAWTYEDSSWWFGTSFEQLAGNLGIVLTYPDSIYEGDDLEVAVTLEYIKNENAKSNYVVFSNIRTHLRDSLRANQDIANSSENVTSGIIRPGEQFSYVFTIPASKLASLTEEYAIDLSFTALFSRSTSLEIFSWDSGNYYLDGAISDEDLRNLVVLEDTGEDQRELVIGVKRPYAFINPVPVTIDGKSYNVTQANKLMMLFQLNSSHVVATPDKISLVPGIQAIFVNWADGSSNLERNVTLDKNREMFAIYKTQYRLDITSEFGTPKGEGWHDSGSNTAFSVDPLAGAMVLRGFDKWEGDYSGNQPFGTVMMDGPKTLQANWKFESTFIVGIVGAIATVISLAKLLPPLLHKLRKR